MLKGKILIVDDSEMNRSILADMLEEEYEILEAEDGEQAVAVLEEHNADIALVLLDIVMPKMDGFGVLSAMERNGWIENLPVIMISSESGSAQVARAYDMGVTDFISRPFDALVVRRRVVNTLFLYAKQKRLTAMVEEQIRETERYSSLMIEILSHIVEFRNGESGLHVLHVRTLTDLLLRALIRKTDRYHLTGEDVTRINVGSALHDIGKIVIDEKILNKPGKLTAEEFAVMKTHAMKGAEMLDALEGHRDDPLVQVSYQICRWHHERWDGRGYPDGLKGDEIPISAQVVALADVYDALTSPRVYKLPIPHQKAVQMIMEGKCGSFNPLLLECLAENAGTIRQELSSDGRNTLVRESKNIVKDSVRSNANDVSASERTLRLMDYERMKHSFFSALTKELQFEYTVSPPVLTMSTWGAEALGVGEVITNPREDEALQEVLGEGGWDRFSWEMRQTTPEAPTISFDCLLTYNGQTRWHHVVLRTIWTADAPQRFAGALGKAVDVHDNREKMYALEKKAARDSMTGLLNHAAAKERIKLRLEERPGSNYALCVFDLDLFKEANDSWGHQFGDRVLKEVAERLTHSVRSSDIIARTGGDEFMLFLEYNTDLEKTINRIFNNLCGAYEDYNISVSMGVAKSETTGLSYEAMFRAADSALYAAKRAGKGRYFFYDITMQDVLTSISEDGDEADSADDLDLLGDLDEMDGIDETGVR